MEPNYDPHKIPYDEKCLSPDDFDPKTEKKEGEGIGPQRRESAVLSDADSDTLVGPSKVSIFGYKWTKFSKLGKEDYFPKEDQVVDWIKDQKSPRRRRWWILPVFIIILILCAILIPVLVVKLPQ
jgi:hypothetical protein